ncbi:MAG: spore coat protein CotJB [Bacillota bacterium]|nr:spore coat protein CotJB [Bacillota bacterium]
MDEVTAEGYSPDELSRRMQQLHFAALEINLYLDTHPDDRQALEDYNRLVQELMRLHQEWVRRYGPLMNHGQDPSAYPWQWTRTPFPYPLWGGPDT